MSPSRRTFLRHSTLGAVTFCVANSIPEFLRANDAQPGALPRSAPDAQNVSASGIFNFIVAAEQKKMPLHSLMILKNGHVITEGWWKPYAPQLGHSLYSLSKSFCSTAVGIAVAEKRFSLDDAVVSFFPKEAPDKISDNLAAMKVRHLLMMGSGHAKDAIMGPNFAVPDGDWIKLGLSKPVEHAPGTHFLYNQFCTFFLSAIVQKTTGQPVIDYLKPRLFEPLGVTGATWESNPQGINNGAWGLRVRTEDIAKLGQLYLGKGTWNGKQILPASWIEEASTAQIKNGDPAKPSDWTQGYGYQFWRCRNDCYRGDGAFGQYCIILPNENAVVAVTAEIGDMQAEINLVWEHLLPALRGQAKTDAPLKEKLGALALTLPAGQTKSSTASRITGKAFALDDNALKVSKISLTFTDDRCDFVMTDAQGDHKITCGIAQWITAETDLSPAPLHLVTTGPMNGKTPIGASAAWKGDKTLIMHWQFLETPHYQLVTCTFDGDGVKVEFKRSLSLSGKDPRPVLTGKLV